MDSPSFKTTLEKTEAVVGSICLHVAAFTTVALFYAMFII